MAEDSICLRLPPDMRAALIQLATTSGASLSDYVRTVLAMHLGDPTQITNTAEVYGQVRALALELARNVLLAANQGVPDTYEEALLRGLFTRTG